MNLNMTSLGLQKYIIGELMKIGVSVKIFIRNNWNYGWVAIRFKLYFWDVLL